MARHQEREDEATLEVVQQEQPQQYYLRGCCWAAAGYPDAQHSQEGGCLHQHPAHLIVDTPAPLLGMELSVTGSYKIQANEDHQSHCHHTCKQVVEYFFCHVADLL